jgi:hypothetical protein
MGTRTTGSARVRRNLSSNPQVASQNAPREHLAAAINALMLIHVNSLGYIGE